MNTWGKVMSALSIIGVAILISLLILLRNIPSDAVIAFLGVLLGGLISGFIQYSMSEASRKQQLRLAALDKRLQTAQEAYTLWRKLLRLPHPDEPDDGTPVEDTLRNCRDWWETILCFLQQKREKPSGKLLMQQWSSQPLEVPVQIGRTSKLHTSILSRPVKL